ncbi:hypothetical protein ABPG72_015670 [Tetrahymena utriculariae]
MSQQQVLYQKNHQTKGYLENGKISQISNTSKQSQSKAEGQQQNYLNHKKTLQDSQQKLSESPTKSSRISKRLEEDASQSNCIYRSYKYLKNDDIAFGETATIGFKFDNQLTEQSSIRYINEQDGIKELLTLEGEYDDAISIEYIKNDESIQKLNHDQYHEISNNKLNAKVRYEQNIQLKDLKDEETKE